MSSTDNTDNQDARFAHKRAWHEQQAQLPVQEKVRILLEMQQQDLELIQRHRPLKWYERPWNIEP